MRILALTSSYPRRPDDIAGRFVFEWAEHLGRLGHAVRVLAWHDRQVGDPRPTRHSVRFVRYAPDGLETLFYGAGAPETIARSPLRLVQLPGALAAMGAVAIAEARRFRADLVVGHWLVPGGALARLVGRATGLASFVVGHSGGIHLLDQLPRAPRALVGRLIADGPLTVPTDALADKLTGLVPSARPAVLPMGFEPVAAHGGARRIDWLVMGRLVPIKGVDLAVEAFGRAGLDATLHVAGDGPEQGRLEAMARRAGSRVRFHGIVRGEAKAALLRRCGFVVCCSRTLDDGRHEGLPVSLLEACGAGLVPLTAAVPGVDRLLVDPARQRLGHRDRDGWAARMRQLAADGNGLGAATAERVAPLAWPQLARRWEQALEVAARGADALMPGMADSAGWLMPRDG